MKLLPKLITTRTFRRIGPHVVPQLDRFVNRLSGGRLTASGMYIPTLLLTTTGRKSGQPRTVPLAFFRDGDRRLVIASNWGKERHPAWSENLIANPEAEIEDRGRRIPVRARQLTAEEKAEVWPRIVARMPNYDVYEDVSGRDIRVFALTER